MTDTTEASGLLRDAMDAQGITDNELRAGIAAIAGGESAFKPIAEIGYAHTSNDRIRSIFAAAKHLTDAQLNALKVDDAKFFEAMYGQESAVGKELGNTQPGDGYLFRGRGLLQLTGRANYVRYGKLTGHPELVTNPELANDPHLAAAIAVAYMRDRYHGGGFDAMKRAVGNSFGNVDDRKNALFRKFLADGTFNAGNPASAPAVAQPGDKPMTDLPTATSLNTSSGTATAPPRVVPTVSQPVRISWLHWAEQGLVHEQAAIEQAANAGLDVVASGVPFGSMIVGAFGQTIVHEAVSQVVNLVKGLDDSGATVITVPDNSLAEMVGNAINDVAPTFFAKAEGFLDGWLKTAIASIKPA